MRLEVLQRRFGATRGHITRQITLEAALTGTLAGIIPTPHTYLQDVKAYWQRFAELGVELASG